MPRISAQAVQEVLLSRGSMPKRLRLVLRTLAEREQRASLDVLSSSLSALSTGHFS